MKQPTSILGGVPKNAAAVQRTLGEAIRLHQAGRDDDALKLIDQAGLFRTAGGQAVAGEIHLRQGRPSEALKAFDAAARLAPTIAESHVGRGAALLALGRLEDALAAEDKAIAMRPDHAGAHHNRGTILRAMGRHEDALLAYARALRIAPKHGAAHIGRALAYRSLGQVDAALAAVDAALAATPGNSEAMHLRCDLLYEAERYDDAVAAADLLIARDAGDVAALAERARALLKLARPQEALTTADRLVALAPASHEAHVIRAAILGEMGGYEESLAAIDEARRLGAPEGEYLRVRALARATLGDPAEALVDFERAIAAAPGFVPTYQNRAFLRIVTGDWPGGWIDHEWRLKLPAHEHNAYVKLAPQWQGEALGGKRLLVYGEQGLGDTLQFVRYLVRLAWLGVSLTLIVPEALRPLLAENFPGVDVASSVGDRGGFDFQVSLMSLPAVFGETLATLPRDVPYLKADDARIAKWRGRIGEDGFRVGIVWQGKRTYLRDAARSIPLAQFAPLATVPGVRLISVQAQVGLEQLDALPAGMKVERLGAEIENNPDGLREMAAAMMNLDLLVMSDTGPTHLAGALGRPVWVALSRYPDWRWMREREDSPWYPNMRLFRQATAGDWNGVFARIARALSDVVRG